MSLRQGFKTYPVPLYPAPWNGLRAYKVVRYQPATGELLPVYGSGVYRQGALNTAMPWSRGSHASDDGYHAYTSKEYALAALRRTQEENDRYTCCSVHRRAFGLIEVEVYGVMASGRDLTWADERLTGGTELSDDTVVAQQLRVRQVFVETFNVGTPVAGQKPAPPRDPEKEVPPRF